MFCRKLCCQICINYIHNLRSSKLMILLLIRNISFFKLLIILCFLTIVTRLLQIYAVGRMLCVVIFLQITFCVSLKPRDAKLSDSLCLFSKYESEDKSISTHSSPYE